MILDIQLLVWGERGGGGGFSEAGYEVAVDIANSVTLATL